MPYSTYYATKAVSIYLTRTTAVQYAPKRLRVNAVLRGLMKTSRFPGKAQPIRKGRATQGGNPVDAHTKSP
jgi:NAD(P)-dependent dehydrogenase (short-subunit alcohol dehydrogenase family)